MTPCHRFICRPSCALPLFHVLVVLLSAALLLAPSVALAAPPRDCNNAAAFYRSLPRVNSTCPDRSHWMRDSQWIHNRCSFFLLLHPDPPTTTTTAAATILSLLTRLQIIV